jgi:hypothetical protein
MAISAKSTVPGEAAQTVRRELELALRDTAMYLRSKMAQYPPPPPESTYRRTGTLGRSYAFTPPELVGSKLVVNVGSNLYYAPWVEEGTGIYGPKGQPIVPTHAKVLAWRAEARFLPGVLGGKIGPGHNVGMTLIAAGLKTVKGKIRPYHQRDIYMIFAGSVRGMRPWHNVRKAFTDADSLSYFEKRVQLACQRLAAAFGGGGA